jgi:hypothetical protein
MRSRAKTGTGWAEGAGADVGPLWGGSTESKPGAAGRRDVDAGTRDTPEPPRNPGRFKSVQLDLAALDHLDPRRTGWHPHPSWKAYSYITKPDASPDHLAHYSTGKSSLMARATHDGLSARIR